jgi:hypothetical protein
MFTLRDAMREKANQQAKRDAKKIDAIIKAYWDRKPGYSYENCLRELAGYGYDAYAADNLLHPLK